MIRKIARPMLASVYIIDGVETVLNPAGHKEAAAVSYTHLTLPTKA